VPPADAVSTRANNLCSGDFQADARARQVAAADVQGAPHGDPVSSTALTAVRQARRSVATVLRELAAREKLDLDVVELDNFI
jgi:hypothetical protein